MTDFFERERQAAEQAVASGVSTGVAVPPGQQLRHGVAQIDSNDDDGAYTITQQVWDPNAGPAAWEDGVAPVSYVEVAARDYQDRDTGDVDQYVRFWEQRAKDGTLEVLLDSSDEATGTGFWARITASESAGDNKWSYSIAEAVKTSAGYGGWAAKSGGRTGTAYNVIEDINAASGVLGDGVNASNLDTDDFTFTLQPCPNGVPVWIRPVPVGEATEYWFAYENGIDGGCD